MQSDVFKYKNATNIEKLYPASALAGQWVKQKLSDVKKVRYVGMEELGDELRSNGLEVIGGTNEVIEGIDKDLGYFSYECIEKYPWDTEVGAVVTGIDFMINYSKIALASMYI